MTHTKFGWNLILAAAFLSGTALLAQDAVLIVHADPRNAIVFVDDQAYKQHDGRLEIAEGKHKIGIYRYGFNPVEKEVNLKPRETQEITAKLELQKGDVDGPWGNLEVRGVNGDYLVFLNGRSPGFCIGRVDEMKGNRVVLPPGKQHVMIVNPEGNQEVNAWYVDVIANRKAIFHADRNQTTYEKWTDGERMHSLPRYQAQGNVMALGPVGVSLVSFPSQVNCGQPVQLTWNAINGYNTLVKLDGVAVGAGGASGQQTVNLKQTTTYYIETFGPGGVSMTPVTIQVNPAVKTALSATPTVVRYHKIGDHVLEPGTATLNWSAANATSVRLDPIGPVTGTNGQEEITLAPNSTGFGPVQETRVYKITASNDCGGSDSSTAVVQVAGSIDPPELPKTAETLPPVLPQTASPLPLIGLLGLGSLASGFVLRRLRNR